MQESRKRTELGDCSKGREGRLKKEENVLYPGCHLLTTLTIKGSAISLEKGWQTGKISNLAAESSEKLSRRRSHLKLTGE